MSPHTVSESIQLRREELDAARQRMGLAVGLGPVGVLCLKHLMESLILFGSGRLLLLLLDRIGLDALVHSQIHVVSHWYEISVFVSFTVFCGIELIAVRVREVRGAA